MKTVLARGVAFLLVIGFVCTPVWATCGGGGGGGGGGMTGGGKDAGGDNPTVYHVPWKLHDNDKPAKAGLILYWFPSSKEELAKSPLKESRDLSLYAAQCVAMELADGRMPKAADFRGASTLPFAVLATPDDIVIGKIENKGGKLNIADVEKLVANEVKTRKANVDTSLKDAKTKEAAGDKDAAIKLFRSVVEQKCMFADKAKDAAKE